MPSPESEDFTTATRGPRDRWTSISPAQLPQGASPLLQFHGDGGVTWSQIGSNLTITSTVNWDDIAPSSAAPGNKEDIDICHM